MAGSTRTAAPAASSSARTGSHSISSKMVACERTRTICNPGYYDTLPYIHPDGRTAILISRKQILARYAEPGATVVGRRTTFGQLKAANPALASSDVVNARRVVWVITIYFAHPRSSGLETPLVTSSKKYAAASVLIDAATGNLIEGCWGCTAVPRG
jgi:hypothetical protein